MAGQPEFAPLPWLRDMLAEELFQASGAARHSFTRAAFARILAEVGAKYLPPDAAPEEAARFLSGLRLEELALARACAAGNESAWEEFLDRYREKLYSAAYGITRDDVTGRELADSLYADLYGVTTRKGERVSKLSSYTGRGSLEGWLRTVLAQEYVNRYRIQRRVVSLEEEREAGVQFATPGGPAASPSDERTARAIDEALAALVPEDRLILAAYFLDGRTLAEIAGMLGVHESTISRKLGRLTKDLRKQILRLLMQAGMSRRQAEEALEVDVRDVGANVRSSLAQEKGRAAFLDKEDL